MALALGCTVRELLARIDSRELAEWRAFYQMEPFGHFRGDLQAGIIASTIANVNKGKKGQAFTPADFMPLIEKQEQTEDDMAAVMASLTKGK